jgi:[acyl-carrier-protein] S-malonyltransferase
MTLARDARAKRALLLQVSAPFHCPLMLPAQQRLKPHLDATPFAELQVPLVNNWRAEIVNTGAEAREGLFQQIPNPVKWTASIQKIVTYGADRFIEVGAGAVLTGLSRQIAPEWKGAKFGEPADLEKLHDALQ